LCGDFLSEHTVEAFIIAVVIVTTSGIQKSLSPLELRLDHVTKLWRMIAYESFKLKAWDMLMIINSIVVKT